MSELENLVPDLELCRKIPKGAFADSVLVWSYSCDKRKTEPFIEERDCIDFCRRDMINAPPVYPAPTLAEILIVQPKIVLIFQYNYEYDTTIWRAGVFDSRRGLISIYDANPTNAALELWLRLNKSDLSDKSDQSDTNRKGGEQ